jgi:predicted RecA/RadA family phage recombinase
MLGPSLTARSRPQIRSRSWPEIIYSLPKTNSALAQGVAVFLTPAGQISGTATGNTPAGYAWDAVDAAATMVSVKLLG